MAADPVRNPPGVYIKADNWFHEGWLFYFLGLDRRDWIGPDDPVGDDHIDQWNDGYDMASECGNLLTESFRRMREHGQLSFEVRHR